MRLRPRPLALALALAVVSALALAPCPALPADAASARAPERPASAAPRKPAADAPRYTFSWPLDGTTPAPRRGSTRGAPVTLDHAPSEAWKALQAPDLPPAERDRRAIVAMAGAYRVSFDFLEVADFAGTGQPARPYQSWGTEKVYVDRDEPGFVSLVHILEMRFAGKDGKPGAPMVTKHWRQDWRYEPADIVEYQGADRWQRRPVPESERRGAWSQTVWQVDESPRYAGVGRWQHTASFSSWIGPETWRPLPRREWSVRSDYQVLLGTNRHTVLPTGWLQEENNLKAVLAPPAGPAPAQPYRGREYGVARYERLRDADFAAADRYYERTRAFWGGVRDAWADAFARDATVTLRGPVDQLELFVPLFERADQIAGGAAVAAPADAALTRQVLADMGVPDAAR